MHAVATSGAPLQLAVLIDERDAEAIDLQLGDVRHGSVAEAGGTPQPFVERAQVGLVVGVVEAEHRRQVHNGRKRFRRTAGDPLGRRIWSDEIGMLRLEGLQFVQEAIELSVRDLRAIVNVIEIFVTPDLSTQPGQPLVRRLLGHP